MRSFPITDVQGSMHLVDVREVGAVIQATPGEPTLVCMWNPERIIDTLEPANRLISRMGGGWFLLNEGDERTYFHVVDPEAAIAGGEVAGDGV
jgi:hypothetical protein